MDERELALKKYREDVSLLYDSTNIIREKCELYNDFIIALINIIDDTYLGPEIIKTPEEINGHLSWCFNKVIENFGQEKIKFNPFSDSYDYLSDLLYVAHYGSDMEDKSDLLLHYFKHLFNYHSIKSPSELRTFIDFYKMFDKNLRKIN